METFLSLLIQILILVVLLAGYVAIVHKAGYSRWWCLIAFIPVVNLFAFIRFAFWDWPLQRDLRFFKALSEGDADPEEVQARLNEDAQALLKDALRFEMRGNLEEAIRRYEGICAVLPNHVAAKDARISLEALKKRIGQPTDTCNDD